jgi:hypothetical protein
MRSVRSLAAVTATVLALAVLVPSASAHSPRTHELRATKECSAYTGLAGSYCTFTSSSLAAIKAGSRIFYASPAGTTSLDSDVVIVVGHRTTATGHCALDFTTGLGKCTFWKGTGELAGFRASVDVSYLGGPDWAWDGTYSIGHHHRYR